MLLHWLRVAAAKRLMPAIPAVICLNIVIIYAMLIVGARLTNACLLDASHASQTSTRKSHRRRSADFNMD